MYKRIRIWTDKEINTIRENYQTGTTLKQLSNEYCETTKQLSILMKSWGINITYSLGPIKRLNINDNYFDVINTEEKAYWLGFLITDGCIHDNQMLSLHLGIKDIKHLKLFSQCLESEYKISTYKNTSCKLIINSNQMITSLRKLGLHERKTFTITVPILSYHLLKHFWRGAIDGDGWLTYRPSIGLCGNVNIVNSFREYCTSINNNIEKRKIQINKNLFQLEVCDTNSYPIIHNLYYNCTIALERKHNKYKEISGSHK